MCILINNVTQLIDGDLHNKLSCAVFTSDYYDPDLVKTLVIKLIKIVECFTFIYTAYQVKLMNLESPLLTLRNPIFQFISFCCVKLL